MISLYYVSHASQDRPFAMWVAWTLEEAGYGVQVCSLKEGMPKSAVATKPHVVAEDEAFIALISSSYLKSRAMLDEYNRALGDESRRGYRMVLALLIEPVECEQLLDGRLCVNFVGKSEEVCKAELLNEVRLLKKQQRKQVLKPGRVVHQAVSSPPLTYPGVALQDPLDLFHLLKEFRTDYPEAQKAAFIIMRFGATQRHEQIFSAIKATLNTRAIVGIRADRVVYSEYIMQNVRTLMHGCGFGIAVFDRIDSEIYNPNVALEVGYMLALGKRVCLLKDRALARMPTDIVGSLYSEFDMDDIAGSIRMALTDWLVQRRLIEAMQR